MSNSTSRAIDYDRTDASRDARRAKSQCNKQTVYCIASIALFIVAGMVSSPGFVALIPGGQLTGALLSIGVILLVLLLCVWSSK
ncbi:MAG: hypothetical protein ACW99U_07365 [Candidatus Thorarchaeota archaeon]